METKDRRILAYLKNAISETTERIERVDVPKTKEELIDEVMKLRDLKRSEVTLKHILEQDDKK